MVEFLSRELQGQELENSREGSNEEKVILYAEPVQIHQATAANKPAAEHSYNKGCRQLVDNIFAEVMSLKIMSCSASQCGAVVESVRPANGLRYGLCFVDVLKA